MKKIFSGVTIVLLLVSSAAYGKRMPSPKEQLAAWAGSYLSDMGKAITKKDFDKLSKLVVQYQDQIGRSKGLDIADAQKVINFNKWLVRVFSVE